MKYARAFLEARLAFVREEEKIEKPFSSLIRRRDASFLKMTTSRAKQAPKGILRYFQSETSTAVPPFGETSNTTDRPLHLLRPHDDEVGHKPAPTHENALHTEEVFTDGSCVGNGKKGAVGGIGVFFADGDPRNVSECVTSSSVALSSSSKKVTNQVTELLACIKGIVGAAATSPSTITVFTDSSYVVKSMGSWVEAWAKNGWKNRFGKQVANLALMQRLYALKKRMKVRFVHVLAHQEEPQGGRQSNDNFRREHALWYGNRRADELATRAAAACLPTK